VIGRERDGNAEACAVLLMHGADSDPAAAVENANRTLTEYQWIRDWMVWPEPDFPRTPTQKPVLPVIRATVESAKSTRPQTATQDGTALASLIAQITGRKVQLEPGKQKLEKDLQLSSLDRVELMSAIEERYQVDLNEVQFADVTTVGQLEKLLTTGPAGAVAHVYPRWPQHWFITAFRLVIYYLLAWPATYLLAAPRVRGRKHLEGLRGPVLVVSNHVTYLDIAWVLPALPWPFRNRLATAMRGERLAEMRHPAKGLGLFERFMEHLRYALVTSLFNVFPLPQRAGFLQSFAFAGDLADRGWNLLVFPEGATSETGEMAAFRSGIGLLAKQLSLPVVPMHLYGLFDLKKEERILTRPGHVRVTIGPPVRFSPEQDAGEITRELERRVRELQSV